MEDSAHSDDISRLFTDSKNTYRFTTARHPLARLYSGWRDKFCYLPEQTASNIEHNEQLADFVKISFIGINEINSNSTKPKNCLYSFETFIKWVIASPISKLDKHILPMSRAVADFEKHSGEKVPLRETYDSQKGIFSYKSVYFYTVIF